MAGHNDRREVRHFSPAIAAFRQMPGQVVAGQPMITRPECPKIAADG
jgi:hypothetical protein